MVNETTTPLPPQKNPHKKASGTDVMLSKLFTLVPQATITKLWIINEWPKDWKRPMFINPKGK